MDLALRCWIIYLFIHENEFWHVMFFFFFDWQYIFLQFSSEELCRPVKSRLQALASFAMLFCHHFQQTHDPLPLHHRGTVFLFKIKHLKEKNRKWELHNLTDRGLSWKQQNLSWSWNLAPYWELSDFWQWELEILAFWAIDFSKFWQFQE